MKGGTIQAFLSAMGCRIQIFFVELLGVSSGGPCFGGGLYVLYLLKSRLKRLDRDFLYRQILV